MIFSPEVVAQKVEPLRKLLEARQKLSNLVAYMDGKSDAEEVITGMIGNEALLKSIMETPKKDKEEEPAAEAVVNE